MSKLTLVRNKTDNVLVIKNSQTAEQQGRHQRVRKSRVGRELKPKRPRMESVKERQDGGSDAAADQDMQCKIVKVILENCKSSTPTTTTTESDIIKTGDDAVAPSSDKVDIAAGVSQQPVSSVAGGPSASPPKPVTTSEGLGNISADSSVIRSTSAVDPELSTSSLLLQKIQPNQRMSAVSTDAPATVLTSPAAVRLAPPLNGVVSQLPLALGHHVQRFQLVGQPTPRNLPPIAAAQRWSVPLVNGAAATWLTLQPVASTSTPSVVAPTPTSFGLMAAAAAAAAAGVPPAAQGAPLAAAAPPRSTLPPAVGDQPAAKHRAPTAAPAVAHSASLINSPIKQFLEHTRCMPPATVDDVPTDLSMKTLRRRAGDELLPHATTMAQQDPDAPLDLCIKRPPGASRDLVTTAPATPQTTILTVPLCFPTGSADRAIVSVAGQSPTVATTIPPSIKLVQPSTTALVKVDPAVRATFPVSPITIVHPAFRHLPPLICSPLLMAPFATAAGVAGVQRHPADLFVPLSTTS